MAHKHELTVLFDEREGRLFAFCGIGDCDHEIEADEIERRVNATFELDDWTAEDIVHMLGHSLDPLTYKAGAEKLMSYAKAIKDK